LKNARKVSISSVTTADGSIAHGAKVDRCPTSIFSPSSAIQRMTLAGKRNVADGLQFSFDTSTDAGSDFTTPQVRVATPRVWPRTQTHRSVSEVTCEASEHHPQSPAKPEKLFDEAHDFGLCEHYVKLLETAKTVGFENVKWPTGFTLFHLAAKKGNSQFIDWLCSNDCNDLHAIDDFGKKPIDYACKTKKDSVYDQLEHMMNLVEKPNTPEEQKYQAIKNGTWMPETKVKKKQDMSKVIDFSQVAPGDVGPVKPQDLMTAHEAELAVPQEYKKCIKVLGNGGWENMAGKWPHDQNVLCWAAKNGKEELCKFLVLECGAPAIEEDGNGRNALYYAKLKKHRNLYKALLTKFKDTGKTKGKKK